MERPSWQALVEGLRAGDRASLPGSDPDPGMWQHGWQFKACDALEKCSLERRRGEAQPWQLALLRSQSGRGAGEWLLAVPATSATTLGSTQFLLALRFRLALPLPTEISYCRSCGASRDEFGHHCLACMRSGLPRRRAVIWERAWAQVLGEA
eukprot:6394150-Karenia_brevis.AAC.1